MSVNGVTITLSNTSSMMLDWPRQKKLENPLIFEQIWRTEKNEQIWTQNVAVNQSNYELWSQAWKFCATSLPSSLKQILVYYVYYFIQLSSTEEKIHFNKNDPIWFLFYGRIWNDYIHFFYILQIQRLERNPYFRSTKFHCRMK